MYRLPLLAALLPVLTLADEPAPDWKAQIESGRKAVAAHDYLVASERFTTALKLAEAPPADITGQLEALRSCARASLLLGRLEQAEQFLSATPPQPDGNAARIARSWLPLSPNWQRSSARAASERKPSRRSKRSSPSARPCPTASPTTQPRT